MKKAVPFLLAMSAAALLSGSGGRPFSVHDKTYYADQNLVSSVRLGLVCQNRVEDARAGESLSSHQDTRGMTDCSREQGFGAETQEPSSCSV